MAASISPTLMPNKILPSLRTNRNGLATKYFLSFFRLIFVQEWHENILKTTNVRNTWPLTEKWVLSTCIWLESLINYISSESTPSEGTFLIFFSHFPVALRRQVRQVLFQQTFTGRRYEKQKQNRCFGVTIISNWRLKGKFND